MLTAEQSGQASPATLSGLPGPSASSTGPGGSSEPLSSDRALERVAVRFEGLSGVRATARRPAAGQPSAALGSTLRAPETA